MQVALYGLLLESRYGVPPQDGLLWYSSQKDMERTSLKSQDMAGAHCLHPIASARLCFDSVQVSCMRT